MLNEYAYLLTQFTRLTTTMATMAAARHKHFYAILSSTGSTRNLCVRTIRTILEFLATAVNYKSIWFLLLEHRKYVVVFCHNLSIFRFVQHPKMTVRISVLWKMWIWLAKNWPKLVVKRPFISQFWIKTVYLATYKEVCNRNQEPILVSVSEPKIFFPKPYFFIL